VLAPTHAVDALESLLFTATSTIGIRRQTLERHKLDRKDSTVETKFGKITGKTVMLPSGEERFKPDHDVVEQIATQQDVSAIEVRLAAQSQVSVTQTT
jgi:uncharacterized protein (DUF111 family)